MIALEVFKVLAWLILAYGAAVIASWPVNAWFRARDRKAIQAMREGPTAPPGFKLVDLPHDWRNDD